MDMYAYFVPTQRRRVQLWQEEVLGMPLLRVELPGKLTPRGCRKLERSFKRWRIHRLFNTPEGWFGTTLPPLSETRPLWNTMASEAGLLLLEQNGISPAAATVEFCGDRFTQETRRLILRMLPQVRAVALNLPVEEAFIWQLQREYGVSPLLCGGDLAICFAPAQRSLVLPLWQSRPVVDGLSLTARLDDLPKGCPELPLLSALVEQGRVSPEQIEIHSNFA